MSFSSGEHSRVHVPGHTDGAWMRCCGITIVNLWRAFFRSFRKIFLRAGLTWLIATSAYRAYSQQPGDWDLVWSDEFDYTGLPDPDKWSYEEGMVRGGERHYYMVAREKNTRVEDGYLIIEAHRERFENPRYEEGSKDWRKKDEFTDYTSGSVTTKHLSGWLYGRVEVRALLPGGRGTWPAIWMLGKNMDSIGWPACGEIDIMENVGYDPDRVHSYVHTEAYNHTKHTQKGNNVSLRGGPYAGFHTYSIEWDEEQIDFFVDDVLHFTFVNEHRTHAEWPFDQPHYLILNLAIGGGWGGKEGIDQDLFPHRMLVDYVRYYQGSHPADR